jgi:hypothetical protein
MYGEPLIRDPLIKRRLEDEARELGITADEFLNLLLNIYAKYGKNGKLSVFKALGESIDAMNNTVEKLNKAIRSLYEISDMLRNNDVTWVALAVKDLCNSVSRDDIEWLISAKEKNYLIHSLGKNRAELLSKVGELLKAVCKERTS